MRGARGSGAVACAALLCAVMLPASARTEAGIEVAERLHSRAPDVTSALEGQLVTDVAGRRLYEVRPDSQAFSEIVVDAYDLDTLEHLGSAVVDDGVRQGALAIPVDEVRHRLFVTYFRYPLLISPEPWMAVVDGRTLEVRSRHRLTDVLRGGQIFAMSYFAPEDKLYILGEMVSPLVSPGDSATNTTILVQWDVSSGSVDWSYPVPSCQRPLGTNVSNGIPGPLGRSIDRPAVYFACTVNTPVANYRFPGTPAVVRVTILPGATQAQSNAFTTQAFPIGGEFYAGLYDPGSDRVFLVNKAFGAEGATAFDGRRGVFLGTIALDRAPSQLGLDPETGRLAFVDGDARGGLTIADGRATPLPQGLFFSAVRSGRGGLMQIDPPTRRYFMKFWPGDLDLQRTGDKPYYVILRDRVPTAAPQAPPDPDRNTDDIDEMPGITGVNYAVGAQAFGARSLSVGGLGAVQDNLIGIELGFSIRQRLSGLDRLLPVHPRLGDPFWPSPGDRDVFFARVQKAFVSTGEASAKAIAVDRDPNTDGDLFSLSNPSGPNPDPSDPDLTGDPQNLNRTGVQAAFPWGPGECVDFGGEASTDARQEAGGRVTVSCDQGAERVEATAEHRAPDAGGVAVYASFADTRAWRDPDRGGVAAASAEAWGIRVGPVLWVSRVATAAEAQARGRPGTAKGAFARVVEGVRVADPRDGRTLFACSTADDCRHRLGDAVRAVDLATAGRVRIAFPEPDATAIAGTPGGFEALVRKDADDFLEEKATNNDERFEVPGMVVTLFNDNHSRSRQVYQFAAVEAEAHYGIFRLPGGAADPGSLGSPGVDVLSVAVAPRTEGPPAFDPAPVDVGVLDEVDEIRTVVERFVAGLRLALTTPGGFLLALTVWGFLAAPVYLLVRRRQVRAVLGGS